MILLGYFTKDLRIMNKIEGFDDAIVLKTNTVIKYSINKCIKIISKDMDYTDAVEHFYFNIKPNYNKKYIKWK